MNFAVFVSGRGTNLQAIIDAHRVGKIAAAPKLVVSDKQDAYALTRAREAGIATVFIDPKLHRGRENFDKEAVGRLKAEGIDFVVLAGFMRILSGYFIREYRDRILNIHPALLPDFKGARAIADAHRAGVDVTGVTVHFVVEEVDSGPVILQEKVPVRPGESLESLEERIHAVEHRLYPKAIDLFARGKLKLERGKVVVLE